MVKGFVSHARTTVLFGPGTFAELGKHAKALSFRRSLLVADSGMILAGYVDRAMESLQAEGVAVMVFSEFGENPDSAQIQRGRAAAAAFGPDSIVALGGGSSLDCAKGINLILTNGGTIKDYWGAYGKATRPMLPMIGISTSTGTGSEAQTHALISDADTHVKMAIGAPGAAFRLVILDPELAATQPRRLLAATGYDAISHAVETAVTTKRNMASLACCREAWRLLSNNFEKLLAKPGDMEATAAMQYGAYLAGAAVELSMLGATHATANPLTARYGTTHGVAIALMLATVVGFNGVEKYRDELPGFSIDRLNEMAEAAGLPRRLRDAKVPEPDLPLLSGLAAKQWTGQFNPRPFDAALALEMYRCAY
ncbi:MAG: iron-containing alcohol dehydrogenase [Bryobacterales bacterium]|nr:iron-containing alcohol dehydrogenase [Bryobacterales bacterium]